jgi:hypothetical protein
MYPASWRLSGTSNIGFGVTLKPLVVCTDYIVSPSDGLIISQVDRLQEEPVSVLLSAFFPFLIEKFLKPPAPSIEILRLEFLAEERERLKLVKGSRNKKKFFGLF